MDRRSRRPHHSTPSRTSALAAVVGLSTFAFTRQNHTLAAGKIESFVDHKDPTHILRQLVGANQVLPTGAFTGAEYYVSTSAASRYNFLHNGAGFLLFFGFTLTTSVNGTYAAVATYRRQDGATTNGIRVATPVVAGAQQAQLNVASSSSPFAVSA